GAPPLPFGTPSAVAQPVSAATRVPAGDARLADADRLQDADRLPAPAAVPAPAPRPVPVVQPVARDSVLEAYRAELAKFPPLTRYVVDLRSRRYYAAGCYLAVEIPQVDRYYYQTEAAARADGYLPGECS
ncbi:MAG TPA: hypothetical protein VHG35_16985, partial [Gemmatimonadales bacterium]|nr:hypothetical protein [Gemmatimonadales bacterium]